MRRKSVRPIRCLLTTTIFAGIVGALQTVSGAQPPASNDIISRAMNTTPDRERGRFLYQSECTSCHGQQAWGIADEEIPALAGQRELYLVTQLAEFLTQDRVGSTMHHEVSAPGISDPQAIRGLAAYLSAAQVVRDPGHGDGLSLVKGKHLFEANCAQCHGKQEQGREDEPVPKLAGQHYTYLLAQLNTFAIGHRHQAESSVLGFTAGFGPPQREAIADYLSRAEAQPPRN